MPDPGLAVDACGLSKWYGGNAALDRVDLRSRPGMIHGLLGPNGAGKTTLLAILLGLTVPDEGAVRLFGRTRSEAGSRWLDGVAGFVETPCFYPYLTGRRNLQVLAGLDGAADDSFVEHQLEAAGLSDAAGLKVRGYSLGMRQRLGLAAALLRRPRLLIVDEPTNGLDPAGARELRAALRRLADDGVSVLVSSHDMTQVEEMCDVVTVLHRGCVVFTGGLDLMRDAAPKPGWRLRTSDDADAVRLSRSVEGIQLHRAPDRELVVLADQCELDQLVVRLGRAGVAVRSLRQHSSPLESLFFQLTGDGGSAQPTALEMSR